MKTWIAWFTFAALALPAGAPPGFEIWTGAQLKGFTKSLLPKMTAQKVASEQLAKYGNHLLIVVHSEASGEAELHQTQADVFIVQTGEGRLRVGGTVVDPKATAPHEIRGPSINGGEEKPLGPGDVVHIPAGVPHQLLVAGGRQLTFALLRVNE